MPYDNYYAIAMRLQRSDGSTFRGVWGLGADSRPPEGQALTVIAGSAPVVSVDQAARQGTVWPDTEMFFPEDANAVKEAQRCLASQS